ncbi:Inner membrane protein translocase and chaperone YidC, long form, partial [hydrothermal vent metagenome]
MENQRPFLYIAFFFTLFLLYTEWQKAYNPQPIVTDSEQTLPSAINSAGTDSAGIPSAEIMQDAPPVLSAGLPVVEQAPPPPEQSIHVVTDVMDLMINTVGGTIYQLDLRHYQKSAEQMDKPFRLFSSKESEFHTAQSGLLSSTQPAPSHKDVYRAEKTEYRMEEGNDELKVELNWEKEGIKVSKVYTFKRDSYVIGVEHIVNSPNWTGQQYQQLVRSFQERESTMIPTYVGGVVYNEEDKYEKIDFDDIEDKSYPNKAMKGGWIAMIQHYFLSAWIPDQNQSNNVYTLNPNGNRYILGSSSPAATASESSPAHFKNELVVGPKLQDRLEEIAPGLELTVDYGILTVLAKPLFWLLKLYHTLFDNWGWAIIFLTITVKLIFYKLSEIGYRSMARMRKVTPRLKALKERYGEDRQRMSAEMMKLYKEEKINPLGGCFPILVQIPVFIALYWVLLESVEMRNAPFALWIQNLSEQDPFYILPILM